MFKAITLYKFQCPDLTAGLIEEALDKVRFVQCGATQQRSAGFVPPRGLDHGPMVEAIDGHYIIQAMTEERKVPGQALKRRTEEIADQVEQNTGRKPGRKLMKELKEQALLELLPMAFTNQQSTTIWIDPKAGFIIMDTAGSTRAEDLVSALVRSFDGLQVTMPATQLSPSFAMAHWLGSGEHPYGFTVDRECELKSCDEMKSVVRYSRHNLDTEEVRAHIQAGKMPTRVAMTWRDRVSFVMGSDMRLKKVAFLDVVFEDKGRVEHAEAFDADVAIATGELSQLIPELLDALGGEQLHGQEVPPAKVAVPNHPQPSELAEV